MLHLIANIIATLVITAPDCDNLRALEPGLGRVAAAQHIAAARDAAIATQTDPALLLAIAWHESRLHLNHVQIEADGRYSCGVGTIEPVATRAECDAQIAGGYVALGRHVAGWMAARDRRTLATLSPHDALIGFAGGYRLIELCRRGPVIIRPGVDTCRTPEVFWNLAAIVRSAHPARTAPPTQRRPNT